MSLRFGHGDTRWFDRLPRDEQIRVLALAQCEQLEAAAARRRER